MEDLSDVTFSIPVKVDSQDRLNNLKMIVDYITHYFKTNFIICEQDTTQVKDHLKGLNYTYIQTKRNDDLIHRTRQLNIMASTSKTPIIVNYDCDVLFKPKQIIDAVNKIRNDESDFVFPYQGEFWDVPKKHFEQIRKSFTLHQLDPLKSHCTLFNPNSKGGAIFCNKEKFISSGGENENFLSWGHEDHERICRFKKFGHRIDRVDGVLYHLNHSRGVNSGNNCPHVKKNANEFHKVAQMNPAMLKEYVESWTWLK